MSTVVEGAVPSPHLLHMTNKTTSWPSTYNHQISSVPLSSPVPPSLRLSVPVPVSSTASPIPMSPESIPASYMPHLHERPLPSHSHSHSHSLPQSQHLGGLQVPTCSATGWFAPSATVPIAVQDSNNNGVRRRRQFLAFLFSSTLNPY